MVLIPHTDADHEARLAATGGKRAKNVASTSFHPQYRETLDAFVSATREIEREAREIPEHLREATHDIPARRLDVVRAAHKPRVRERLQRERNSVCDASS
jgi:hypothetical protein